MAEANLLRQGKQPRHLRWGHAQKQQPLPTERRSDQKLTHYNAAKIRQANRSILIKEERGPRVRDDMVNKIDLRTKKAIEEQNRKSQLKT